MKNQYSTVESVKTFAGILVAKYSERFPIAEIYVNVGIASAEVERIFSDMNSVMTKLRNSMSVTKMSKNHNFKSLPNFDQRRI